MTSDAEVASALAVVGAEVLRDRYGGVLERFDKGGGDLATSADLEAEDAVRRALHSYRPEDAFLGEERGADGPASARTWLVDPLCGTRNFAARTPLACTNVALRVGDRVRVAAVADPFASEVYWTDGEGAFLGDHEPLRPSAVSALVDVDFDRDPARSAAFVSGLGAGWGLRVCSTSLALAWVATGRRAGYVAVGTGPVHDSVHFAAGTALCTAAGCVVTDLDGSPLGPSARGLLAAADPATHTALVAAARRS